ncbi:MAG TPA: hypothetical protein VHS09_06460 [Polyangiaceae bacterium]|nr:hypothetical protein [Polyangiaceae bacterium]
MSGAPLNLHDVEAVDDRPRAPGVAPGAEAQRELAGGVEVEALEALGRAAREGEVLARRIGEALLVVDLGEQRQDRPAPGALLQDAEERKKVRVDGDRAVLVRLGLLDPLVLVVPRLRDADLLAVDVDVGPRQHAQLAGARVGVDRDHVRLAPIERDGLARGDERRFRRVRVHLDAFAPAGVGRLDAGGEVDVEDAELAALRREHLAERHRQLPPHVAARLGGDVPAAAPLRVEGADRGVDVVAHVLDVVARELLWILVADAR